jgi:hypothetical protein
MWMGKAMAAFLVSIRRTEGIIESISRNKADDGKIRTMKEMKLKLNSLELKFLRRDIKV